VRAGIIGGGVIGAGWVRLLAAHGYDVRLFDTCLERSVGAGTLQEAVEGADLVIEAVSERLALKRAVLTEVGALAPADCLIASSSSSFLPSLLQEGVAHPERVLVLHPLHPVELIPVVEVVPGAATSVRAVARARNLLVNLGKSPVVLRREVPGYIINRLVAALFREAIALVLEGVADPAQIDLAASKGPCLGWAVQGPFLTYQVAAPGGIEPFLEHLGPAFSAIWRDLSDRQGLSPQVIAQLSGAVAGVYGTHEHCTTEAERDEALRRIMAATL
jgi:carnitine 3-dehydrogenase